MTAGIAVIRRPDVYACGSITAPSLAVFGTRHPGVTTHPADVRQMAGPPTPPITTVWTHPVGEFLDALAFTQDANALDQLYIWGEANGMCRLRPIHHTRRTPLTLLLDDLDTFITPDDYISHVVPEATDALRDASGMHLTYMIDATNALMTVWAQSHLPEYIQGVWWNLPAMPSRYTVPHGVVFQRAVHTWTRSVPDWRVSVPHGSPHQAGHDGT